MSLNNEGGFIEILGDSFNNCYRYNVSVNDGYRSMEGEEWRAGAAIWVSGKAGWEREDKPAVNNYIYNNTIYCKEEYTPTFRIASNTQGLFIANNIFYLLNTVGSKKRGKNRLRYIVFRNNLYCDYDTLPHDLIIQDEHKIIGDPQFFNPGGDHAEDYIPENKMIIRKKGIVIERLPDNNIGIFTGLKIDRDYFGNIVSDVPSLGAIEV